MLFPIGVTPPPRRFPFANFTLIAINVAVFLLISLPLSRQAMDPDDPVAQQYVLEVAHATGHTPLSVARQTSAYDLYVFENGFRPTAPTTSSLFFAMFLHAGWMHLIGNMVFLWIFGGNVEERMGSFWYALAYLATGAAAMVLNAVFVADTVLPTIGASGAISGVLGFYYVWFPRHHVRMLFWFYFFASVILIPARLVLGFFLIVENLLPFLLTPAAGSGVAYGAHIGGFLAGFLVAQFWDGEPEQPEVRWVEAP